MTQPIQLASAKYPRARVLRAASALLGCVLALALGATHVQAQAKTFAKQRKYVTPHTLPPSAEIPVAPEAAPAPDAAPTPEPAAAAPVAPVQAPALVAAPAPAGVQPAYAPAPPGYAPGPAPAPNYAYPPPQPGWSPAQPAPSYAAPAQPPALPYPPSPAPAPAAPMVVAAAPPGYVLVPVAPAPPPVAPAPALQPEAQRAWLAAQLAQVDQQLYQLRRERKSIAGPSVQMGLGYASALVCAAVALGSFAAAEELEQGGDWGDPSVDGHDEQSLRNLSYAFTGLSVVGLAIGIGGTARLIRNRSANRVINTQRKGLMAQRTSLKQQLSYFAAATPNQLHFALQGRF